MVVQRIMLGAKSIASGNRHTAQFLSLIRDKIEKAKFYPPLLMNILKKVNDLLESEPKYIIKDGKYQGDSGKFTYTLLQSLPQEGPDLKENVTLKNTLLGLSVCFGFGGIFGGDDDCDRGSGIHYQRSQRSDEKEAKKAHRERHLGAGYGAGFLSGSLHHKPQSG